MELSDIEIGTTSRNGDKITASVSLQLPGGELISMRVIIPDDPKLTLEERDDKIRKRAHALIQSVQ